MKHRLLIPVALMAVLLAGCSSPADSNTTSSGNNTAEASQAPEAEPLDLTGEWKQTNSNSADTFQAATITADRIEVDWVNEAESSTAIYWVGTFAPPTEAADSYSWESQADAAALENAILASQDPTKTFTYENGVLSYELTAMGVTMTVEMERQ